MFISGNFDVERFRYWQGQKLRARDFQSQAQIEAELHWWHNRALHRVYGVASGLEVTPIMDQNSLVGLKVGCGVAYDSYGRDLLLQIEREISLPDSTLNRTGKATLLARYQSIQSDPKESERSCACATDDQIELVWFDSHRIDVTDGVALARLNYESAVQLSAFPDGSRLSPALRKRVRYDAGEKRLVFAGRMTETEAKQLRELSTDTTYLAAIDELSRKSEQVPILERRFKPAAARAMARPRIGSGQTVPGDTLWEFWIEPLPTSNALTQGAENIPIGMQTTVSTSAAGFTETPCYSAWLEGTLWTKGKVGFFPVPLIHIDQESIGSFRLRLWLPPNRTVRERRSAHDDTVNVDFVEEFINYARRHGLHVCWMGIQSVPAVADDCRPAAPFECVTTPGE